MPEATGIPDMSQGFAFELRMTDVSAEGRPSHTWPLLTMGEERFLQFPEPLGTDRRVVSPAAALPWVQVSAQASRLLSARVRPRLACHTVAFACPKATHESR